MLETLSLGIAGKIALWQALDAALGSEGVPGFDFRRLAERGELQRAIVERQRLEEANIVLSDRQ